MHRLTIDSLIQVAEKFKQAASLAIQLLNSGKSVDVIVQEHSDEKPRSNSQNKMIYAIYQRIANTLYGKDCQFARNECKLRIGCRILYRDSEEFRVTFDKVVRPLNRETKLAAMELISVSSIMTKKQCTEYIESILNEYTLQGCYFSDIEGTESYSQYREAQ